MAHKESAAAGPPAGPRALWITITVVIVLFMAGAIIVAVIETHR